jgi:hypothetical protein
VYPQRAFVEILAVDEEVGVAVAVDEGSCVKVRNVDNARSVELCALLQLPKSELQSVLQYAEVEPLEDVSFHSV